MSRAQKQHQGQEGGSSLTHLIFVAFVTVSAKYRVILFSLTIFVNQLGGLTKQVQNYKPDVCNPQTLSKVSFITFFYESVRKVLIPWHHATQIYFDTIIKLSFFLRKYKPQIFEILSGGCHSTVSMVISSHAEMSNTMHLYNS